MREKCPYSELFWFTFSTITPNTDIFYAVVEKVIAEKKEKLIWNETYRKHWQTKRTVENPKRTWIKFL